MEIQSRNASELPPAMAVDITRTAREAIQERQPLTPPQVRPPEVPVADTRAKEAATDEVQRARTEFRERAELEPRTTDPRAAAAPQGDAIDISKRSRQLMAEMLGRLQANETAEQGRAEKVEALKSAYESGELATDERVSLAAERMLEGE